MATRKTRRDVLADELRALYADHDAVLKDLVSSRREARKIMREVSALIGASRALEDMIVERETDMINHDTTTAAKRGEA